MRGDRKPIRPSANNRYINDLSHDTHYTRND
jgi:hypothetical protein